MKDKDWNPPKFEGVKEIAKQIQNQETPSKKQARDKNLMLKSFEEAKKMHGKRLYPYKLDFVEFFSDVSDILKGPKRGKENTPGMGGPEGAGSF